MDRQGGACQQLPPCLSKGDVCDIGPRKVHMFWRLWDVDRVSQALAFGTRRGASRSASPSWSMIQATAASTPDAPEKCSARTALRAAPGARQSDPEAVHAAPRSRLLAHA